MGGGHAGASTSMDWAPKEAKPSVLGQSQKGQSHDTNRETEVETRLPWGCTCGCGLPPSGCTRRARGLPSAPSRHPQAPWMCPLPSIGSASGRLTPLQEPLQGDQRHQRAANQAANGQLPGHLILALLGEWSAGWHGAVQPRVMPSGSQHVCVWMRGCVMRTHMGLFAWHADPTAMLVFSAETLLNFAGRPAAWEILVGTVGPAWRQCGCGGGGTEQRPI